MNKDKQANHAASDQAGNIFFDALDFESIKERRAFLEKACSGDADLSRQVDSLFATLNELGNFLEDDSSLQISAKDLYDTISSFPQFRDP